MTSELQQELEAMIFSGSPLENLVALLRRYRRRAFPKGKSIRFWNRYASAPRRGD